MTVRTSALRVLAAMSCGVSLAAQAQAVGPLADYPTRPIRLLIPSPPGGSNDAVARLVGNGLSRRFGRTVVADNRPGGGGVIASELVARARPDGYTLLIGFATFTTLPFLHANLPYDPLKDFSPVTEIANQPLVLAVSPSVPVNTVKELIELARSKPGGLTAAHTQIGSATHLATEMFKLKTGTTKSIVSVTYNGGAAAQLALVSGEVQVGFATSTAAMPQIKAGKIRVIAISAAKRVSYLPEVPTLEEAGVPGVEAAPWQGLLSPARTPRAIVNGLHAEIVNLLKLPETLERLTALGSDPVGSSPEEFTAKLKRELQEFGRIIKAMGLKPQ